MAPELQQWVIEKAKQEKEEALDYLFRQFTPLLGDMRMRPGDGSLEVYTAKGWELI